jgi:hypothetical protein
MSPQLVRIQAGGMEKARETYREGKLIEAFRLLFNDKAKTLALIKKLPYE